MGRRFDPDRAHHFKSTISFSRGALFCRLMIILSFVKLLQSRSLRAIIVALDFKFAGGRLKRKYYFFNQIKSIRSPFVYRLIIGYNHKTSLLHDLFLKHGSDKGAPNNQAHPVSLNSAHTYADLYYMLFHLSRHSIKRVFECGLGTNNLDFKSKMGKTGIPGASLRAWRDYFPNAEIFGADIDSQILFSEDRIKTFHVDQTVLYSIENMWQMISVEEFDIIVDDGLHTFDAGISLFEASFSKLREGGIYLIEDITPEDKFKFYGYFNERSYRTHMVDLHRPYKLLSDNSVVIIWK